MPAVGSQVGRSVGSLNAGVTVVRACRWKRRSLHLSLVSRCRRRPHISPPRMDGSLFISSRTRKHMRWKRGKLRAHMFFKHAGLLRFGRGVLNTRQPFVELNQSTLNFSVMEAKTSLSYHDYFRTNTQLITHRMLKNVCLAFMRFVAPLVAHIGKRIVVPFTMSRWIRSI